MIREGRYQTRGSRWGPGKVHRYWYDRLNKLWHPACLSVGETYYGEVIDPKAEVTCKKCL